jgi:hypothetical protein
MDAAADLQIAINEAGEDVTFMTAGYVFTTQAIFDEWEDPVNPMDGETAHKNRTLSCRADTVKDVTVLYTAIVGEKEYPVIATPPPIKGMATILLGSPK